MFGGQVLLGQDDGFVGSKLWGIILKELAVRHLLKRFLRLDLLGKFGLLVLLVGLLDKLVELFLLLFAVEAQFSYRLLLLLWFWFLVHTRLVVRVLVILQIKELLLLLLYLPVFLKHYLLH